MNEFHNVSRVDAALRLVGAVGVLALVRFILQTGGAERVFVAMLVAMPLFVYLFLTALIRDDVLYVLWDVNTTLPRGKRWSGHHGEREAHFE